MSQPASPGQTTPASKPGNVLTRSMNLYIFLVLIALLAFFSIISPNHAFFERSNFINIAWDTAEILLLAIGETFVIVTAGIDLSVGTVLMFSGVIASWTMAQTGGPPALVASGQFPNAAIAIPLGIAAGICVGTLFGLINGVLVTRLRMPAFIVTLGVFSIANGLGDLVSSGGAAGQSAIPPIPGSFANTLGNGNLIFGLPTLVVVAAFVAVVTHVVLTRTLFGRRTFAVGSNLEGSRLAGVPVNSHVIWVYVFAGFMAGLAGVLDLARFHSTDIQGHSLDNLDAIAAVVIGGTSLFGGTGSIVGTVIGAFIPTVLRYGFTIQGISSFWQDVVVGAIIIVAVLVDQIRRRRVT
ncbi:MAG: ABC transporter permease [Candidatus Velthaea sp.]